MPSGAKKRKAAKKKKESTPSNHNNPGNDDVKSQDSDGEEFSTPAFRFQKNPFEAGGFSTPAVDFHETPFQVGGEDLEKTGESKSMEEVTRNESENFVEDFPEFYSPGYDDSKTMGIEHVQSSKESLDKDYTSSRSSSSDDESGADDKEGDAKACNAAMEAPCFGDLVSKEVAKLREIATVGEGSSSVLGNTLVSDAIKPVVSESVGVARVKEYAPIESSAALDTTEPGLKENGDKLLAKFNELTRVSTTAVDSQLNKNSEASSNAVKFAPEDSEGKAVSSSSETDYGAEQTKNSETPQNPENEPLLPVAPRPVQTTSWKSCCGLFEVLSGSNR